MPRISVDLDLIRQAVFDRSLSQVGDSPVEVKLASPVRIGRLSVDPEARLSIQVFNRAEDRDDGGVLARGSESHIPFETQSAWVRYRLTAGPAARVRFATHGAGISSRVELSGYRRHPAGAGAIRTMRRDLDSFRTVLQLADVRRMRAGEALSMDVTGSLTAEVETSWSDVLSNRLTTILGAAGIREPVVVRLRRGASASARVRVSDRFSIVVSRREDGLYRFAVRKAQSRDHHVQVESRIGVEATATGAVEDALEPLFEAITGAAVDRVRAITRSAGPEDLPREDREILERIARSLGLGSAASREKAVVAAVDRLRKVLREELDKALRWKAQAGFAYEYARVAESEAILDYVLLDPTLLAVDHALLLSGDLARLRDAVRDSERRTLVRYLNETSVARTSTHGFSLGLGKWVDVRATEKSAFRLTTRTALDGMELVTARGTRRYEENQIPQNDVEWTVDFKAQMPDFRRRPSTRDFDYGLHYAVTLERAILAEGDLERMRDFAAMWDVVVPSDPSLSGAIGRPATIRVQLLFERADLERLLTAPRPRTWADALAAAMPYMSTFPERAGAEARREVYATVWARWLDGERHAATAWAAMLAPRVRSGLRAFEERGLPGSFAWTAGEGHPQLKTRLDAFERGLRRFRDILERDTAPAAVGDVYEALSQFWSQRLYVAASGRYLLDCAQAGGVDVSRSLLIEFDETSIAV